MANDLHTEPDEELKASLAKNLDDIFGINDGPVELTKSVEDKRKTVTTQSKELQELEQRLKEAEERLRSASTGPSARTGGAPATGNGPSQGPPSRAPPQVPGQRRQDEGHA